MTKKIQQQDNYTSLNTSRKLMELGCELDKKQDGKVCWCIFEDGYSESRKYTYLGSEVTEHGSPTFIPAYNITEIITNGDMAKAFFGERLVNTNLLYCNEEGDYDRHQKYTWDLHTDEIKFLLLQNKKESAEAYLLANTIFNKSK